MKKKDIYDKIDLTNSVDEAEDFYNDLSSNIEKMYALQRIRHKYGGTPQGIICPQQLLKEVNCENDYDNIYRRQKQRERTLLEGKKQKNNYNDGGNDDGLASSLVKK